MSSAWNSAKKDNWEKRLATSEDTIDPPPLKEKQIPTSLPEDVEEGDHNRGDITPSDEGKINTVWTY
ncbi:hypothetical protein AB205_0117050 [Aquarana catesbeiana]|uniref:Uncharacterized protein n=1 Tax=Aquarana catesbeiana TaxID=8400 RepID=A0A2G9RW66_AQUCT|nr:hypothetical protein AB205_0117050 [Aquarana catesbeiana]